MVVAQPPGDIGRPIFRAARVIQLPGGTLDWDATAGTKWSTTSGGVGGEAVPTTSDDVFFDARDGAVTVTIAAHVNCKNLDCTGFTGTLVHGNYYAITCKGTVLNLFRE